MKGVILAGGTGSRLYPCTKVTNKHLLPVYNKPMIYYPLQLLANAGIKDILIISGEGHAGDFLNLLGSGKEFGVDLAYDVQEGSGGIAHALKLARNRKSTRLNSSHSSISYAVFCLKKNEKTTLGICLLEQETQFHCLHLRQQSY